MAVSIIVSLYSTRLILLALGASDFGIFNVVGGSVAMLGFFNSTMSNATQRYTSWALGKEERLSQIKVFNVSLITQLFIALLTTVSLLIIKPFLFGDILNINPERISEAEIVYYCLIVSSFLTIINVPYEALINAHENMGYYTIVGFIEAFLKLGIAFACLYSKTDKLVLYGILMTILPLINLSIMKIYCHRKYPECIIKPLRFFDKDLLISISKFSGWNFLTAISHLVSLQGMGLVLNHFFGTILNAAQGISNQVNGLFSTFSLNLMKALNPVITKKAAIGDNKTSNLYSITGSKYSSFLFMLIGIPVSININYVLKLWLTDVPDWTNAFCIMQFINLLIMQTTSAVASSIYANGDIKYYAIVKSIINILPILVMWMAFKMGASPLWLFIPVILILGIGGNCVILYFARQLCYLSLKLYISQVILPVIGCMCSMLILGCSAYLFSLPYYMYFLFSSFLSILGFFIALYSFGITKNEKHILSEIIKNYIKFP